LERFGKKEQLLGQTQTRCEAMIQRLAQLSFQRRAIVVVALEKLTTHVETG